MNSFLKPHETTEYVKLTFQEFLDFVDQNVLYWEEESEGEFEKFLNELRQLKDCSEKEIKNFVLLNSSTEDFHKNKMCKGILTNKYIHSIQIRKNINKKLIWSRKITSIKLVF